MPQEELTFDQTTKLLETPFEEFYKNGSFRVCSVSTVLWIDPTNKDRPLVVGHQVPEISVAIEQKFINKHPKENEENYYYCVIAFFNWDSLQKDSIIQPVDDRLEKAQNSRSATKRQELEEALKFANRLQKEMNGMSTKALPTSE